MITAKEVYEVAFAGLSCHELPCTSELFRMCCEDEKQEIASLVCCTMLNISREIILRGEY